MVPSARHREEETERLITKIVFRRLLPLVPLLTWVSVLGFTMMHLLPGGPTVPYTLNPIVITDDIVQIEESGGLKDPGRIQYLRWSGNMFTCDFDNVFPGGAEGRGQIGERVPATPALMRTPNLNTVALELFIETPGFIESGFPHDRVVVA